MLLWATASVLAVAGLVSDFRGNSSLIAYQVLAGYILLMALVQLPYRHALIPAPRPGLSPKAYQTLSYTALAAQPLVSLYYALLDRLLPSDIRRLPGPTDNTPLIGQAKNQFTADGPAGVYVSWSRNNPDSPFIRFRSFFDQTTILVNSVDAAREILSKECYSFTKPSWFSRMVGEISGVGLLFSEFHDHKRQRKLLTPCFSPPNLKKLVPVFREKAAALGAYLNTTLLGDDHQRVVEISSVFTRVTLSVIGTTALGIEIGHIDSKSRFQELYDAVFSPPGLGRLVSFINIWMPLRWLPIKANTDFVKANEEIQSLLRQAIRKRQTALDNAQGESELMTKDLLSYMLENIRHEGQEKEWTEDVILGHLLNFVGAGHETTASGLTWCAYVLSTQPGVQDKLREELSKALEEETATKYADLDRLPLLDNFVKEVLRLYSPVPVHPRESARDLVLAGSHFPKGTNFMICPAVINQLPSAWGVDADDFRPERWSELAADSNTQYAFQPFFQGPRGCIGRGYAILEMKTMVCEMVTKFRIEAVEESRPKFENPSIMLKPEGGLNVLLTRL